MIINNIKRKSISFVMTLFVVTALLFIVSCEDQDEIFTPPPIPGGCDTTKVTFSETIQMIISSNCNCHGLSAVNFAVYDNLKAAVDNGKLLQFIQPNNHFSSGLDTCDVQQITAWINKGAPNN